MIHYKNRKTEMRLHQKRKTIDPVKTI